MNDIKQLYDVLFESPSSLSDEELTCIITDFSERVTDKINTGNAGDYNISRNCNNYIFNGFLIRNSKKKTITDFCLFIDSPRKICIADDEEVLLVNCDYEKATMQNQLTQVKETLEEKNNVEATLSSLERLSNLFFSGAITEDEYKKLKKTII